MKHPNRRANYKVELEILALLPETKNKRKIYNLPLPLRWPSRSPTTVTLAYPPDAPRLQT